MTSATAVVLDNVDLVRVILAYLSIDELLDEVQYARKIFFLVVPDILNDLKHSIEYSHLLLQCNRSNSFSTDKKRFRRIASNRTHMAGGFLILGGSFGSLNTKSYWIRDNPNNFEGVSIPDWSEFETFGSTATVLDKEGCIRSFGGWPEHHDGEALSYGFRTMSYYKWAEQSQQQSKEFRRAKPLNRCSQSSPTAQPPSNESEMTSIFRSFFFLPEHRCYSAAATSLDGRYVYLLGGCTNPFRQARMFRSCIVADLSSVASSLLDISDDIGELVDEELCWQSGVISDMQHPRGGHGLVVVPQNENLITVGGYGGGLQYHKSAEMWDWGASRWLSLPDMHERRSGMAIVLGTDNAVYVAGGSPDGVLGHSSLERFDPREGTKWHKLADMTLPRGYISGAHGGNGLYGGHFYVTGGLHQGQFLGGLEYYDARRNAWHIVPGSCSMQYTTSDDVAPAEHSRFPYDNDVVVADDDSIIQPWYQGDRMPREGMLRAGFQMIYTM